MLKDSFKTIPTRQQSDPDTDGILEGFERLLHEAARRGSRTPRPKSMGALLMASPRLRLPAGTDLIHSMRHLGTYQRHKDLLVRIAESASAPALLYELAFDKSAEVRSAVAENMHTRDSTKFIMAGDESPDVRFVLAECSFTPMEVLRTLSEDDNPYVASRANQTLARLRQGSVARPKFGTVRRLKVHAS